MENQGKRPDQLKTAYKTFAVCAVGMVIIILISVCYAVFK